MGSASSHSLAGRPERERLRRRRGFPGKYHVGVSYFRRAPQRQAPGEGRNRATGCIGKPPLPHDAGQESRRVGAGRGAAGDLVPRQRPPVHSGPQDASVEAVVAVRVHANAQRNRGWGQGGERPVRDAGGFLTV